jgi:tRNA (cytidine/uridine-2'-O-)-methyltransferase
MLHVALYQPMIPPNVGNAGRTCVGLSARLHLVGPHQLDYSQHAVKRAGLDYWEHLDWQTHPTPQAFLEWAGFRRIWRVTKHGRIRFDQADYVDEDVLLFGNEKTGLPDDWLAEDERTLYIPIRGAIRSYNLGNTVAIVGAQATVIAGLAE